MVTDKIIALALHLSLSVSEMLEITECEYDTGLCKFGNQEYYVLTDDEADEKEKEIVGSNIQDCYIYYLDKNSPILEYLDVDQWIEDWCGKRAENLGRYNRTEDTQEYEDELYYIYRIN